MGKENDGPKGRDREYCGQDWLWGFWLAPVEDVMGELWGVCERRRGVKVGEMDLPGWKQRYRGRDAS